LLLKKIDMVRRSIRIIRQLLLVKISRKPRPVFMYLHLTNRCNLRCSYCYANVNDRFDNPNVKDLKTDEWKKLIDDSYLLGARYFHLYGGEPLIRNDIDELVDHCLDKGLFVEVLTNGHFVKNKIETLKKIQSVCISLDGDKKSNDRVRGDGNFEAVEKAVKVCAANGIRVRLHSTLNSFNSSSPSFLPSLAQQWNTTISYSVPHVPDHADQETVNIPDKAVRHFLASILRLKRNGMPIDNTYASLKYTIQWPFSINTLFSTKNDYIDSLKGTKHNLSPCVFGKCAVVVDSEGYVIKCINLHMNAGLKFQDLGFANAYAHGLVKHNCFACSYPQFAETSNAINLSLKSILKGAKHHL